MEGAPRKRLQAHYEDDIVQEHTHSPGWKLVVAATIAVIFSIVFLLNFAMEYSERKLPCRTEDECAQLFLKGLSLAVVMIVTVPLAIWVWRSLIRRYETGSRIDLEKRLFIWWDGPQPRLEHNIELDKIIRVKLVDAGISYKFGFLRYHFFGDGKNLELLDIMGNKTTVRGLCVKSTRDWGRAVKSEFPHIHVETE